MRATPLGALLVLSFVGLAGCQTSTEDDTAASPQNLEGSKKIATTSEDLLAYLKDAAPGGALDSWSKRNARLKNHGCGADGDPLRCLASKPEFTFEGGSVAGSAKAAVPYRIVNLLAGGSLGPPNNNNNEAERALPIQETKFWIRSSANGRYVGMSDFVLDLERWEARSRGAMIKVSAPFDPQFTPDNKTVSWANTSAGGIAVCLQSSLEQTENDASAAFDFDDDSCSSVNDGVYQSFATSLDAALPTFMTDSKAAHTNDAGVGKIEAVYTAAAETQFTPIRFNGTAFDMLPAVQVPMPFEGDVMLSPSGRLLVSRVSDGTKQTGYRISRIDATAAGNSFAIKLRQVGAIDLRGAKGSFSFDERFIATHSYGDQADPNLEVAATSADIVLVDLVTGTGHQLTKMPPGVRALYPHFRSDGWLYFLVRDGRGATKREFILATDAALRIARGP